jgi:Chaperone of endosialidase
MPKQSLKACLLAGSFLTGLTSICSADPAAWQCGSFDCDQVVALFQYDIPGWYQGLSDEDRAKVDTLLKLGDLEDGINTISEGLDYPGVNSALHDLGGSYINDLNNFKGVVGGIQSHGGGFEGLMGHLGNTSYSDIRLKRDIQALMRLDNGLTLYRFRYLWSDVEMVGVMAQEVLKVVPEAVAQDEDGYYRVDYGRLGLRFVTYAEWLAERSLAVAA